MWEIDYENKQIIFIPLFMNIAFVSRSCFEFLGVSWFFFNIISAVLGNIVLLFLKLYVISKCIRTNDKNKLKNSNQLLYV